MKKILLILICAMASFQSVAAIFYVGDEVNSANCDGSNHHDNLFSAILAAVANGTEADEIRLTNQATYLGNSFGSYSLTGHNDSTYGELKIVGGYADCNSSSSSGTTNIGSGDDTIFKIRNQSVITLENLGLSDSHQGRGLQIFSQSHVTLNNVDILFNSYGGVLVHGDSILNLESGSSVDNNFESGGDFFVGSGIACLSGEINISGRVSSNLGFFGGNIYIGDGCYGVLEGGSAIVGGFGGKVNNAEYGGGIYVAGGGLLFANGGADRVVIRDNSAEFGGAVAVVGTGQAVFINTYFLNNKADSQGAGLYVSNGGTSEFSVVVDRTNNCPNLISCSEFEQNQFIDNLIYIKNSKVRISRTIFDRNELIEDSTPTTTHSLIEVNSGSILEMEYSNMLSNKTNYLFNIEGVSELAHITAVGNYYPHEVAGTYDSFAWVSSIGDLRIENSIFQDTQGGFIGPNTSPDISGKCNLIDNNNDWPEGSFTIGAAIFNNTAGGDARQQSNSDGVDMCLQDTFSWTTNVDVEAQLAPVNEDTNPQGFPGETGGFYDAGFDEVYDNIADLDLIFQNG
ncbi:MAG: hypothetical protein AB8B80_04520, partial [Marinicellaceae bacterium]